MRREKHFKISIYILIVLFIAIVICSFVQLYNTKSGSKKTHFVNYNEDSSVVQVKINDDLSNIDSWVSQIQMSDNPDDIRDFTGATIGVSVVNGQNVEIGEWTLRIDISSNCYLNGFWCGEFEVHQFRNGEEIVEVVNMNDIDLNSTKLVNNKYSNNLMIELKPGDYLIYFPSEELSEKLISSNSEVGIGMILYFEEYLDLSNNTLTYYNNVKFTQGVLFVVIRILGILFVMLLFIIVAAEFTYKRAKQEMNSLAQTIISGLTVEYKTLWLISVADKTIQLVRNSTEAQISNVVGKKKECEDYDISMKYYIDNFVDEKDRARVWSEVNLESLIKHLSEERHFSVYYLHQSEEYQDTYFQMIFAKSVGEDNSENIVLAYRDVDDFMREDQQRRKQLEEALQEANRANQAKSSFLANMSHEIRTPINAILGMDTMILRETSEESVKEYAKDIRNAGNTLLALINDILDFSKIESGKMELSLARYQLDSVVNDLMNMVKPKAEEKGLELELNLNPETPVKLFGDEIRVKQIMLNILNNAIKYTKQGKITWTIDFEQNAQDECELVVSVADTGIGIKKEDIDKLFSPYERLELNKNRTVEGTGLGLSITKYLLDEMHSHLEVESVYGEGSVFSFRLIQPVWGPEVIGNNLLSVHEDAGETPEKYHAPEANILVVDDVEMNLIVIRNLLKRVDIKPDTCLSGSEALELTLTKKYDLILLDAMMPEMSGEETFVLIRNDSEINRETPIVVLTANAISGAREQYLTFGFSGYLSKPVNGVQLEDMIQSFLPEEKIILSTSENFVKSSDSNGEEISHPLLDKIKEISELDVESGVQASGGVDTYINICTNFYETAESRIQMIQGFYDARDAQQYAIQTHALKSSARLIGATALSEMALDMELAGKSEEWEAIDKNTNDLLAQYQNISKSLKEKIYDGDNGSEKKKSISEKKLKKYLTELKELVEAYDFESAKEMLNMLKKYELPEDFKDSYNIIKVSMAEVDYDGIINEISTYLS